MSESRSTDITYNENLSTTEEAKRVAEFFANERKEHKAKIVELYNTINQCLKDKKPCKDLIIHLKELQEIEAQLDSNIQIAKNALVKERGYDLTSLNFDKTKPATVITPSETQSPNKILISKEELCALIAKRNEALLEESRFHEVTEIHKNFIEQLKTATSLYDKLLKLFSAEEKATAKQGKSRKAKDKRHKNLKSFTMQNPSPSISSSPEEKEQFIRLKQIVSEFKDVNTQNQIFAELLYKQSLIVLLEENQHFKRAKLYLESACMLYPSKSKKWEIEYKGVEARVHAKIMEQPKEKYNRYEEEIPKGKSKTRLHIDKKTENEEKPTIDKKEMQILNGYKERYGAIFLMNQEDLEKAAKASYLAMENIIKGNFSIAISFCTTGLRIIPDDPIMLQNNSLAIARGIKVVDQQTLQRGLRDLEKLFKTNGKKIDYFLHQAMIFHKLGDRRNGNIAFLNAIKMDSEKRDFCTKNSVDKVTKFLRSLNPNCEQTQLPFHELKKNGDQFLAGASLQQEESKKLLHNTSINMQFYDQSLIDKITQAFQEKSKKAILFYTQAIEEQVANHELYGLRAKAYILLDNIEEANANYLIANWLRFYDASYNEARAKEDYVDQLNQLAIQRNNAEDIEYTTRLLDQIKSRQESKQAAPEASIKSLPSTPFTLNIDPTDKAKFIKQYMEEAKLFSLEALDAASKAYEGYQLIMHGKGDLVEAGVAILSEVLAVFPEDKSSAYFHGIGISKLPGLTKDSYELALRQTDNLTRAEINVIDHHYCRAKINYYLSEDQSIDVSLRAQYILKARKEAFDGMQSDTQFDSSKDNLRKEIADILLKTRKDVIPLKAISSDDLLDYMLYEERGKYYSQLDIVQALENYQITWWTYCTQNRAVNSTIMIGYLIAIRDLLIKNGAFTTAFNTHKTIFQLKELFNKQVNYTLMLSNIYSLGAGCIFEIEAKEKKNLDGDFAKNLLAHAYICFERKDFDAGISCINIVNELGKSFDLVKYSNKLLHYAKQFYGERNLELATKYLLEAIRRNDNNSEAHSVIAKIYSELNNTALAKIHFDKAGQIPSILKKSDETKKQKSEHQNILSALHKKELEEKERQEKLFKELTAQKQKEEKEKTEKAKEKRKVRAEKRRQQIKQLKTSTQSVSATLQKQETTDEPTEAKESKIQNLDLGSIDKTAETKREEALKEAKQKELAITKIMDESIKKFIAARKKADVPPIATIPLRDFESKILSDLEAVGGIDSNSFIVGGTPLARLTQMVHFGKSFDKVTFDPDKDVDIVTTASRSQILNGLKKWGVEPSKKNDRLFFITVPDPDNIRNKIRVEIWQSDHNTLTSDLLRRDYTINTFLTDKKGHVYDLLNAYDDLKNRIIKTTISAPTSYTADPSRILRGQSLKNEYPMFNFDIDLKSQMDKHATLIPKMQETFRVHSWLQKYLITCKPEKLAKNIDFVSRNLTNIFDERLAFRIRREWSWVRAQLLLSPTRSLEEFYMICMVAFNAKTTISERDRNSIFAQNRHLREKIEGPDFYRNYSPLWQACATFKLRQKIYKPEPTHEFKQPAVITESHNSATTFFKPSISQSVQQGPMPVMNEHSLSPLLVLKN